MDVSSTSSYEGALKEYYNCGISFERDDGEPSENVQRALRFDDYVIYCASAAQLSCTVFTGPFRRCERGGTQTKGYAVGYVYLRRVPDSF